MFAAKVIRLKAGEKVLRVVRQHRLKLAGRALVPAAFIAAPFFFMLPLFRYGQIGVAVFGASIGLGLLAAGRLAFLHHWNAGIITSARVVDIDQKGLFERVVSEAPYEKIQDVSYRRRGVVGTLADYGTVLIQTAGATSNLELSGVGDPKEVHHAITAAMAEAGQGRERTDLLGAAAGMSGPEAKAFLSALKGAVTEEDQGRQES